MIDDAFTFMVIVKTLATFRAKDANLRHRECFYWQRFNSKLDPSEMTLSDVAQYLPPRREWARPKRAQRHSSRRPSVDISRDSICRKVQGVYYAGRILESEWGRKLSDLVKRIQDRVATGDFNFERPELMLRVKAVGEGCQPKYRCISAYRNIEDRVILSIANKYLSAKLDGVFSENSHAFRIGKKSPVARAIRKIIDFRNNHAQMPLYVSECDIVKFFDTIEHGVVLRAFKEVCDKLLLGDKANALVKAFLESYDVRDMMNSVFWDKLSKTGDWDFLAKLPTNRRTGLPQGGALSGLLSNLVLDKVDKAIGALGLGDFLYIRYCDDIIMLGSRKDTCTNAIEKCSTILEELNLRTYPARSAVSYGAEYYVAKSKGPFLWGDPSVISSAIPWVSFLGYSIRYDGSTRLRKETLLAHAKSIREECQSFILNAKRFGFRNPQNKSKAVEDFLCRLMAKGTGRINIEPIKGLGRCWLAVFRFVGESKTGLKQMKYLDYIRSTAIARALRLLNVKKGKAGDASAEGAKAFLYFGKPFSYYGSCEKLKRTSIVGDRDFSLCEKETSHAVGELPISNNESQDKIEIAEDNGRDKAQGGDYSVTSNEAGEEASDGEEGNVSDEEFPTSGWGRASGYFG